MHRSLLVVVALVSVAVLAADPPAEKDKKAPPKEKEKQAGLVVGADLPGAFHPYIVKNPHAPFVISDNTLAFLAAEKVPAPILAKLKRIKDKTFERQPFLAELARILTKEEIESSQDLILNHSSPRKSFGCLLASNGLNAGVLVFTRDLENTENLKALLQQLDNGVEKNPNVRLAIQVVFVSEELKDPLGDDDKRDELAARIEEIGQGAMLKHVVLALASKADLDAYHLPEEASYTIVLYSKYEIRAVESLTKDQFTPEKIQTIMTLLGTKLGVTRK